MTALITIANVFSGCRLKIVKAGLRTNKTYQRIFC